MLGAKHSRQLALDSTDGQLYLRALSAAERESWVHAITASAADLDQLMMRSESMQLGGHAGEHPVSESQTLHDHKVDQIVQHAMGKLTAYFASASASVPDAPAAPRPFASKARDGGSAGDSRAASQSGAGAVESSASSASETASPRAIGAAPPVLRTPAAQPRASAGDGDSSSASAQHGMQGTGRSPAARADSAQHVPVARRFSRGQDPFLDSGTLPTPLQHEHSSAFGASSHARRAAQCDLSGDPAAAQAALQQAVRSVVTNLAHRIATLEVEASELEDALVRNAEIGVDADAWPPPLGMEQLASHNDSDDSPTQQLSPDALETFASGAQHPVQPATCPCGVHMTTADDHPACCLPMLDAPRTVNATLTHPQARVQPPAPCRSRCSSAWAAAAWAAHRACCPPPRHYAPQRACRRAARVLPPLRS